MKKAFIIFAILAFATPSFAALIASDDSTVIGGAAFQPSTLVILDLETAASAYSAGSKHLNGSKCYASVQSASTITAYDGTIGTDITNSMVADADTLATSCQ